MTSKVVQQGRLLGSSDVCPIALSSGPANTSPLRTPGKEPSAGPLPNSPPEVTSVHLTETVCTNNNANPLLHATNLRKHNKRAPLAPTRASSSAEHHGKKILPINMVASTECSGPAAQQLSTTEPAERLGPILFAIGIDGSSEGDLATLTNNKVIEEQVLKDFWYASEVELTLAAARKMLEETLETLLSDPKDYIRMTRSLFSAMTPEQRTEWSELAAYHKDARAVLTSSQQEPGGVAPNVAIASASNKATAREPHHDAGALKSGVCGSPARKRALLERLEKTASDLEAANKRTSLPTEGGAGAAQRGSGTSGQGYFPEPPEDDEPTSPRSEKKRLREILKEVKTATKKRVRLEERALDKLLREQEREVLAAEKKLEKEHEQAIRAEAKREKAEKTRVEAEAKKERKRVEKEATDKQRAAERQEAKALAAEHRVAATAARETTAQAEKKYTKSLDISSGLCPYVRPANRNGLNAQPCGGKLERISNVVLREGVFGVQYECTRATGCPFVKRRFSHVG